MVGVRVVDAHHVESLILRRRVCVAVIIGCQFVAPVSVLSVAIRSPVERREAVRAVVRHGAEQKATPFFRVGVGSVLANGVED